MLHVYDNQLYFVAVTFGLSFVSDSDVRDGLYLYYKYEDFVAPNQTIIADEMQRVSDAIRDRYNHLYETTQYEYDPIKNYDMSESEDADSTVNSNSHTLARQYPMDTATPSPISDGDNTGGGSDVRHRTLSRSGNIGVTTTQQMIEAERRIIIDLLSRYYAEYRAVFCSRTDYPEVTSP